MRWTIGTKIGSGFAFVLTALLIVSVVSYDSTTKLIESVEWVRHTHEVLNRLGEMLSVLKDAETGQREFLLTGEQRDLAPYRAAREAADQTLKDLRKLTADNPIQQRRLDALEALMPSKFYILQQAIDLRSNKSFDAAQQVVLIDKGKVVMDDIRRLVNQMEREENDLLAKRSTEERDRAQRTKLVIVLGSLLSTALLILVGVSLARNIATPLREIAGVAQKIASGDLGANIVPQPRNDEVGVLAQSFIQMTESLRRLAAATERIAAGDLTIEVQPRSAEDVLGSSFATMRDSLRRVTSDMRDSVSVLTSAGQQIVAATTQVASGAREAATAVTETTTTVEEVRQTAQLTTQKAKYVSESAKLAAQVSQNGRKSVEESIDAMNRIRDQMQAIAEGIVRLSEQNQAIGDIMVTVNDLSEQSNLLAVNASIEAARAGEQGKGFAVVAHEIRSLAEQSKQAAGQVRSILNDIQKATSAAVMATEQGGKAVETGVTRSRRAGESVQKLTESISEAAEAATQIAAANQQQMVGMDQIVQAMENIKTASIENLASTKQTETAAKNMQELGQKLKDLVAQYRV